MTKKIWCSCEHDYQDRINGSHIRLHNKTTEKYLGWRCTVCGKEKLK